MDWMDSYWDLNVSKISYHSARVLVAKTSSNILVSSTQLATLLSTVSKRGSFASSSMPIALQKGGQSSWRSMLSWNHFPSEPLYELLVGNIMSYLLPRMGVFPVIKYP